MMQKVLTWTLVIVLSASLGAGAVVGIDSLRSDGGGTTTIIEQGVPSTQSNISASIDNIADLYEAVRPSVVRISGTGANGGSGVGSGVVLDKEGHILTNNHVVDGLQQ